MLRFLSAGESHGPSMTAILEGIPAGLELPASIIDFELARRQKGYGSGGRMKIEKDIVQILGGVMAGETTGAPISMLVQNNDHVKWKGKAVEPMRVAAGAVCKHFLAQFGILIGGYVSSIGKVTANFDEISYEERFTGAEESEVRCPDKSSAIRMRAEIEKTIQGKNTLGGVLEIVALNVPAGLGSFVQWDKRLEAKLAMAIMSVQAIKGVEVGDAFTNTRLPGTQVQDAMTLDGQNSKIKRPSNRAGGVEGGISNGQPIVIRAAMKPIATTLTPQQTVDLATGEESPTHYERSDFCPVPRAVPILEAMVAFVLADALIEKLGGDSMKEMKPRFETLRKTTLEDLQMDNVPHIFWE